MRRKGIFIGMIIVLVLSGCSKISQSKGSNIKKPNRKEISEMDVATLQIAPREN